MANISREDMEKRLAELEEQIRKNNKEQLAKANESGTKEEKMNHKWGLCLGGGGGKGAYQIGVFKALYEYGLMHSISAISGASIGAINELLIAGGNPEKAQKAWQEINMETVFSPDIDLILNSKPGFFSRKKMLELIDKYADINDILGKNINLYANVTKHKDNKRIPVYYKLNTLQKEDIIEIVTASSALPLIYESVTYKGEELEDGGLTDNIPVKPLYDEGLGHIIVVGLNPDAKKDLSKYENVDFIEIYPSITLGDLAQGTLNFSEVAVEFREKLGYKDAVRALKVYFEANPDYIAQLPMTRQRDIDEIKAEMKYAGLDNKIKESMSKFDDLAKRYY
jgi:NTE family protein